MKTGCRGIQQFGGGGRRLKIFLAYTLNLKPDWHTCGAAERWMETSWLRLQGGPPSHISLKLCSHATFSMDWGLVLRESQFHVRTSSCPALRDQRLVPYLAQSGHSQGGGRRQWTPRHKTLACLTWLHHRARHTQDAGGGAVGERMKAPTFTRQL